MEISGAVLQRSPAVSGVRVLRDSGSIAPSGPSAAGFGRRARVSGRAAGVAGGGVGGVFSDVGHLKYYAYPVRCGGVRSEKEEKKRAKLVKGLSRGLADLCTAVGIGADAGDVKGKMIAEAAELLRVELTRLRAEGKKDSKRKRKEAKAAAKAARKKDESSSSSSSSESSDGECHKVVRMRNLRAQAVREPNSVNLLPITVAAPESETGTAERHHHIAPKPASLGCSVETPTTNKIEVCMGGKCRRSGGPELMQELSRKIGVEGAVVGCKCMGKCRDGPNVRVLNRSDGNAGVLKNPLCLGVGIDDVGAIVANYFLGEKDSSCLMPAYN